MKENNFVNNGLELKNRSILSQISQFYKKHPVAEPITLYGFISVFILAVFTIALKVYGIFPFGDATISSYDMSAQIAPFIEHFFDVIDGKSSLFYSYAIAGGADVFGTLAYCCVSPFTFLFLIFGKGNVYYATAIVLPSKIVCVAIAGLYYVRKRFSEVHPVIQLVLALSYAFSGYLFVSNTYINWVDLMIYLPFVVIGFYKIKTENKKSAFIVALSLMIYTCFSISCFSLLLIFPVIVLYCLIVEEKETRKKLLSNTIWALALAIILALPILLPAFRAFLVSGRKTSIFENLGAQYSYTALYKKTSYLFTDSLTLFFTLVYFIKNGVKEAKNKFLALTSIILFIPVFIDESMNLLNFGSYMSYSLRFGFLNGFYFFYIACLFFSDYAKEKQFVPKNEVNKKQAICFNSLVGVLAVAFCIGLVIFYNILQGESFVQWFSSRLAHSEGGLEGTAIVFGCFALIALLGIFLVNYNKMHAKFFALVLVVTVCAQSAFYGFHLVSGNYMEPTKFDQMGALTDYVEELEDNDHTRIKMCGDYLTSCMPLTLHTNSYSVFSSVIDNRNFIAPAFFAFGGNGKNQIRSYNGRIIGDVVFGNKYFITDGSYSGYYGKFLKVVEGYGQLTDEYGNAVDIGNFVLYENKYALPHAFAVDNANSKYSDGLISEYDSVLKMLGGEECGVEELPITVTEFKEGIYKVAVKRDKPGDYYITSNFENMNEIRYARASNIEEKNYVVPDDNTVYLGYSSIGSGTTYVYYVSLSRNLTEADVLNCCKAFRVGDSNVTTIYEKATAQTVDFSLEPNKISVKLNASDGQYLFVNYVALPGHTAIVNGKEVALEENELNFMLVKLENGENEVQIVYRSPYIKLILIGLAIAVCVALIYLLIKKKFSWIFGKFESLFFYLGLGLAIILVAFYIVMPTCVCLVKNIKLLVVKVISFF